MDIEQVLDVARITAGSWQKLIMGEQLNPEGGIQLDPVVNCNTFSKAICTFLGSMLRKTSPSTQIEINKYNSYRNSCLILYILEIVIEHYDTGLFLLAIV